MVEENISILGLPTLQVNFIHHVIPRYESAILQWCAVTVPTFTIVKTMAECLGYLAITLWLSMLVSHGGCCYLEPQPKQACSYEQRYKLMSSICCDTDSW